MFPKHIMDHILSYNPEHRVLMSRVFHELHVRVHKRTFRHVMNELVHYDTYCVSCCQYMRECCAYDLYCFCFCCNEMVPSIEFLSQELKCMQCKQNDDSDDDVDDESQFF